MPLLPTDFADLPRFPTLSRRLRLGVVGGGRIAGTQAIAARLSDRWDVVAGALSSRPQAAQEKAAAFYIDPTRAYTSMEAMAQAEAARDDGVDAVMITTPNHLHYAAAQAFLDVGIPVLCDKPLTNDMDEALGLIAMAERSEQVFGVSYVMSCYPMVRQARALVQSGQVGEINQIHVEFMQDWMTPETAGQAPHEQWRLDPKRSGATSTVGDIGTHAAHLAGFVSGLAMTSVRADFHVCGHPKTLEDTAFMMTRFVGDVPGSLLATRLAPGNRGGLRLRVFGSEGGIEWDMEQAERLKLARFGHPDQIFTRGQGHGIVPSVERLTRTGRGFPEGLLEAWANLYTEFAMAVALKQDGLARPDNWLGLPEVRDGAAGVAFVDAAVRSNSSGQWAEIAQV